MTVNSPPQANCVDNNETNLLTFESAQQAILNQVSILKGTQRIAINQAKGRCLAENIISPRNVPPHNNSAMDGYALHHADLPTNGNNKHLKIYATLIAGQQLNTPCPTGYCVRIMTGAAMPNNLDTVIMQEHCTQHDNSIAITDRHHRGQNVRLAGEDIIQGQTILKQGKVLSPADIGLLASLGITEINVTRKLRVAIASTGNELCDISQPLPQNAIYDSNRYSLLAALDRNDIELIDLGIIADNKTELLTRFTEAAKHADIIISSGGVSVGSADFTKDALSAQGNINFWKVAIKPARPIAFGTLNQCLFFGLPGNPVAVLVSFYQFVLPAITKILGITDKPIAPILKARCLTPIHKKSGRTEIQRGIVTQDESGELQVHPTKQGSGILSAMSAANAFIILPHDSKDINQHEWVDVQLFSGLL